MIDLTKFLADWEYDPERISVQTIVGDDGSEKLIMRIDLGFMQMETEGRPDGQRISASVGEGEVNTEEFDTYLDLVRFLLSEHDGAVTTFRLNSESLRILRREATQFQHRFMAFAVLGEWENSLRDITHCLEILDMARDYADANVNFEEYRIYLLTKRALAQAEIDASLNEVPSAIAHLKRSILEIRSLMHGRSGDDNADYDDGPEEIEILQAKIAELRSKIPAGTILAMHSELREAISQGKRRKASTLRRKLASRLKKKK